MHLYAMFFTDKESGLDYFWCYSQTLSQPFVQPLPLRGVFSEYQSLDPWPVASFTHTPESDSMALELMCTMYPLLPSFPCDLAIRRGIIICSTSGFRNRAKWRPPSGFLFCCGRTLSHLVQWEKPPCQTRRTCPCCMLPWWSAATCPQLFSRWLPWNLCVLHSSHNSPPYQVSKRDCWEPEGR